MRIAFYAESCLPVYADVIGQRPLGGTETALVRLAEVLQQRGHEVTVFTSYQEPPPSIPRYLPSRRVLNEGMFDILVIVQRLLPALLLHAPAKQLFFWTGDGEEQFANWGLGDPRVWKRLKFVFCVSNWHLERLSQSSGLPAEKCRIIGNGVHLPYFSGSEERCRKRLIYTAAPYRGLALIPEIFSRLKKTHPDLELDVFSGFSIYDRAQPFKGALVDQYANIEKALLSLKDCRVHGNVLQSQLARELMKAGIFVYPNTVFETCCICAMEALAAGCPVVASNNSALPETVKDGGFLIDGEPGSAAYLDQFTATVDRILNDNHLWSQLSKRAAERARQEFSWSKVAERFESLIG